jgi:UDPglucose 6-dehydrogenase
MSKVGMVGLGKLGLPCLLAMEKYGEHDVFGYEVSKLTQKAITDKHVTYWEKDVNRLLVDSKLTLTDSAADLVGICDIIFVAVPTPHDSAFEGLTPIPDERRDFDYQYLRAAARDLSEGLKKFPNADPLIVVISTVLPGTMRTEVLPILQQNRPGVRFAYNPYFIAMGTTVDDFMNPEFFLIGSDNPNDASTLASFYSFVGDRSKTMKIESAELTKVAYNTFIGFKIVFANALSEIVQSRGGDVDEVTEALADARYRLMSPKYLSAGMGDGGGCHPRDQIAMSWLATEAGMSFDIFEFIARARDEQTLRQASQILGLSKEHNLPILILGKSYKENSPLTIGSPALLLQYYLNHLQAEFIAWDPWVDGEEFNLIAPVVAFIASKHEAFKNIPLPVGSIVVDPWGFYLSPNKGIKVITPGRANVQQS